MLYPALTIHPATDGQWTQVFPAPPSQYSIEGNCRRQLLLVWQHLPTVPSRPRDPSTSPCPATRSRCLFANTKYFVCVMPYATRHAPFCPQTWPALRSCTRVNQASPSGMLSTPCPVPYPFARQSPSSRACRRYARNQYITPCDCTGTQPTRYAPFCSPPRYSNSAGALSASMPGTRRNISYTLRTPSAPLSCGACRQLQAGRE